MRAVLGLVVTLVLASGCSRASEESQGKRVPVPPPPPEVTVPPDLSIPVSIDGVAQAPIDAAMLNRTTPDFADDERRAWRLTRLVPAFAQVGATVEAHGRDNLALKLPRPESDAAPAPVLFLTRRGGIALTVVDPAEPFPTYHGQGGRLRRPGDPLPHLAPIRELLIVSGPR